MYIIKKINKIKELFSKRINYIIDNYEQMKNKRLIDNYSREFIEDFLLNQNKNTEFELTLENRLTKLNLEPFNKIDKIVFKRKIYYILSPFSSYFIVIPILLCLFFNSYFLLPIIDIFSSINPLYLPIIFILFTLEALFFIIIPCFFNPVYIYNNKLFKSVLKKHIKKYGIQKSMKRDSFFEKNYFLHPYFYDVALNLIAKNKIPYLQDYILSNVYTSLGVEETEEILNNKKISITKKIKID